MMQQILKFLGLLLFCVASIAGTVVIIDYLRYLYERTIYQDEFIRIRVQSLESQLNVCNVYWDGAKKGIVNVPSMDEICKQFQKEYEELK